MPKFDLDEIQETMNQSDLRHRSAPTRAENSFDAKNLPSDHPMWELWERMGEMFGHQWASQQGECPNDTWLRGCADLSVEQLGQGIKALLDRGVDWPPSLPAFRALCRQNWESRIHQPFVPATALEDLSTKERKLAMRKAGLAQLRKDTGF